MTAKFTALSLTPEGNSITHRWPHSTDGHLAHMQAAVGGCIEHVDLGLEDLDLWVDEEGAINDAMPNMLATEVALQCRPSSSTHPFYDSLVFTGNWFYGTVLFTGGMDDEGTTLPLSEARLIELLRRSNTVTA